MTPPKVSILIPTRNYARYLSEALDSVLTQDFPDYEVLIADNASTDDTPVVAAQYAARDQRIRSHRHAQDLGMAQNFNWCLSQARGAYIKFLLGDDRLAAPRALGHLVTCLDVNPTVVLAGTARQVIDESSQPLETWDSFRKPGLHRGTNVIARCLKANLNLIGEPSTVIFRRGQGRIEFDPAYRQLIDLDLWFRLLETGDFFYGSELLSSFRRHSCQQSEINRGERIAVVEAARLAWKHFDNCPLTPREKRDIVFRHAHALRHHTSLNPEALQLRREITAWLGPTAYAAAWCRYRLSRLARDILKPAREVETSILDGKSGERATSHSSRGPLKRLRKLWR
jgi:glycosyltransferase involved in cell wall biosynthesis